MSCRVINMANFGGVRRKFSNHRQWRDFIAAVHESVTYPCSVTYPMAVLKAVRSGRAWCSDSAALASSWLSGIKDCGDDLKPERT